jgi:hypothetical protein
MREPGTTSGPAFPGQGAGLVADRGVGQPGSGGHAVAGLAAERPHPARQLGGDLSVGALLGARPADQVTEPADDLRVGDEHELASLCRGVGHQGIEQPGGDIAGRERPAMGVPVRHRRDQVSLRGGPGRVTGWPDPGEQQRLRGFWLQRDGWQAAELPQPEPQAEHRRTAAHYQLAASGVDRGQLPVRIGEQLDAITLRAEPPWLGIVQ